MAESELWRKLQGKKAQGVGASFENLFLRQCKKNAMTITRFPNGCRRVGAKQLIQVKTPWDWIITHGGRSAFIDTKTSAEKCFPHSKIELNQITEMLDHEEAGAVAGYVIWLRPTDKVIFVNASSLAKLMRSRGSITEQNESAIYLGGSAIMLPKLIFTQPKGPLP